MALLTRSRRSAADPAAEAMERAREVSEQVAGRARELSVDAVERAGDAAERARAAAEPRLARAREATEPRLARAREVAEPGLERAREASAPALAQVRSAIGALVRLVLRLTAVLPSVGAKVLAAVARLLGSMADRSAEIAHVPPPSRAGRRRRAALWFVGGFATGAAAGYAVSELTRQDRAPHPDEIDEPWQPAATPPPRANANVPGDG